MKNGPYPYYEIPELKTLRELVAYGRDAGGEKTVFYTGKKNDVPLSFAEAYEEIEALGTWLLSRGLRKTHIAILGENSTEWCLSYFAVVCSGNVAVPLDRELPREDLAELIEHCGCQALIYSPRYADRVEYFRSREELAGMESRSLGDFERCVQAGKALLAAGDRSFAQAEVRPETLACIVYTSGTSRKSKGVMLSHGNLTQDVVATCQCVTARNTQIFLPLNHSFSWASAMFAAFLYTVDAHISGDMRRIVKDLNQNRPQNISAVPMMVELLYNGVWNNARRQGQEKKLRQLLVLSRALMALGIDLRRRLFRPVLEGFGGQLETVICGGATLDRRLQQGLYDLGILVINGYGITECAPVVAVNRNRDFRFGSVGKPLPCNRVRIDKPDENGVGEIWVSGSNVMQGYYRDPEATAAAFDGEWFKTGDYGYLDRDGFLFITGRKKNLIILSNGKNVLPEELEERLRRLEYVKEVAVYEEEQLITGEFYLDEQRFPDARQRLEEDVKAFNSSMPSYKNIKRTRIRSVPFEKTTTMKIKRYLLKSGK